MTLEQHITDTLKEWQLKLGNMNSELRLYYPYDSICGFLQVEESVPEALTERILDYLKEKAPYLGEIRVTFSKQRFCLTIPKEGCEYVNTHGETSAFLQELLAALKTQEMEEIRAVFLRYAELGEGQVLEQQDAEDGGRIFYFDKESIDPYVYCFEEDAFGITYHRFTRMDYEKLK